MIKKLTAKHEEARQVLENLETHDADLRRRVRELTKQASSLYEVLKNKPIDETDLRLLTDFINIKQNEKTVEVHVELKRYKL